MPLQLDIPDEFFDPKPFYPSRASAEAVLREIKEHIKQTGEPHTWRHHTHSKPVTGARIVYLGTFDLPPSHQAADRHAPCPCCSPRAPKFSHKGKIAWFPDEHVIRMIGPECFQTLNPEGHWEAVAQFDREESERRTIDYLIKNLHLAVGARKIIEQSNPTLEAIDHAHATLQNRLSDVAHIDIWRHVGRGVLNVNVTGRRMRRSRDGSEQIDEFLDIRPLFEFPSHHMFSPKTSRLHSRMKACATRLGFVDFGDELQERVRTMAQEDRAKSARILSNGLSTASTIFEEATSIRNGFAPMGVAALKGWTKHEGCPIHLYINGDNNNFYVGKDETQAMRIELPPAFWHPFGEIPKIPTVTSWSGAE
ncbi:MAG: hypothetical protein GC182_14820 [Rhodopseudomonas sp.]|nr:hypothetical protein [Rhodopseudomonas sp.]